MVLIKYRKCDVCGKTINHYWGVTIQYPKENGSTNTRVDCCGTACVYLFCKVFGKGEGIIYRNEIRNALEKCKEMYEPIVEALGEDKLEEKEELEYENCPTDGLGDGFEGQMLKDMEEWRRRGRR